MKKIHTFLCVTFILFFVFACTTPSEVEITGSPSLSFAADMNFDDFFSDMIDSVLNTGDNEVKRLDCTNPSLEYKTYFLYISAFKGEDFECEMDESKFLNENDEDYVSINGVDVRVRVVSDNGKKRLKVLETKDITSPTVEPYTLSSSGFGDYLEGFEFTGINSKMYISGTDLVKALSIELYHIDSEGNEMPISSDTPAMKESGVESLEEYTALELPAGGEHINIDNIINSEEDLSITYKIYSRTDEIIDFDCFRNPQVINIEIVIWLPMTFESKEENARFNFQGFFDGIANVIKSVAGAGSIDNMSINININPINPFSGGIFVIKDDNYAPIQSPLDDNSFSFGLEKKDLEHINKNSFNPSFFVLYPEINSYLRIPNKDIMITTVSINTELNHNAEF